MEKRTSRAWVLILGTIAIFFAGILYAWSVIKTPLGDELGFSPSQLSLNFTFTMITFCLGGFLSGNLLPKVKLSYILAASAILSFVGFFISSRIGSNDIGLLYLSYGGFAGLGIGMAYNSIISVINEWFPDIKGTASGVLMMSFGASALILGNLANAMITKVGWRETYLVLGCAMGIALLLAAILLRHTREEDNIDSLVKNTEEVEESIKDYKTGEMVKRSSFIRFFLFLVLACAVGNSTVSIARDVAVSVGAEATLAATLAGVLSLCNGLGRVIAGILFDKFGQRITMTIDGVITIIAPVIMLLALSSNSVILVGIGLAVTGLSYAFQPPITSSVVSSFYGKKYFPKNFSVANMNLIPASFVATISGVLYSNSGSYIGVFALLLVFAIVSFALNLSVRKA
ncbi:MAG: MFS transporter [Lachnospiraceae bacterium]|nr:MFS transporter [Lachnospiraceae bacterium]